MQRILFLFSLLCLFLVGAQPQPWLRPGLRAIDLDASSTDHLDCGSNASLDNLSAATILVWLRPETIAGDHYIVAKIGTFDNPGWWLGTGFGGGGTLLRFKYQRSSSVMDLRSTDPGVATAGAWQTVGVTWDTGAASTAQRLFFGSLTSIAEANSYSLQQLGSGTHADDDGETLVVGNSRTSTTQTWDGQIAAVMIWNTQLTVAQLNAQLRFPYRVVVGGSSIILHTLPGTNGGTSTSIDLSGNGNNCTATGVNATDQMPLR